MELEEIKNLLPNEAKGLSDAEVLELYRKMDALADIFFSKWLAGLSENEEV